MSLDKEQLARLAHLARLEIDPAEADRLGADMEKIVELAARVAASAADSSLPIAHIQQAHQPLRSDDPKPVSENLSQRAAQEDAGMVVVPKVVD